MSLLPKRKESIENPLVSLREEMNRLFDSFWSGGFWPEKLGFGRVFPSVEVTETDDEVVIRAEVPGMEAKDLELTLSGDVLTIKGEKKEEKEEKEKQTVTREVHYGAFSRSIQLPSSVNVDKVQAECKKGVCRITLAKKESEKGKKIRIKAEKE